MKYCEAKYGRIFVIRLEDGEILHETIEKFAVDKGISRAALIALGGSDKNSRLVVGPEKGRSHKIIPMEHILKNVHEVSGVGTIFPSADGNPVLHMHISCGRKTKSITGCVRRGVRVWHVLEVIIFELTDCSAARLEDTATGFELLAPEG